MDLQSEPSQRLAARLASPFYLPSDSERRLLGLVFRSGGVTQAALTRQMDLTQPTVSRLVSGLATKGLVSLGERTAHGRGQPSAKVSLVPDYAYSLGVSLLGDAVSMDVMNFAGEVVWRGSSAMPNMGRPAVLRQLGAFRDRMLQQTGIAPKRIFAAGVGVSAFFVGEERLMNPPHLLDDWALVDIAPIIEDALQVPVVADNDGNVACIGEQMTGVGKRFRTFAYFQITNGFGGGVIIEGQPWRGAFGNAGEFAALWQAVGIEHPNLERLRVILRDHGVGFDSVAEMIREFELGLPGVEAWLNEAAFAYSLAATAASAVIDCEAIVLGGRIPRPLAERLSERIAVAGTNRRGRPRPLPVVLPAEAPGDAVSLGAGASVFQGVFFE